MVSSTAKHFLLEHTVVTSQNYDRTRTENLRRVNNQLVQSIQ
jgi:ribosome-associated protein YbcJ (S4-like RNA binding protein)